MTRVSSTVYMVYMCQVSEQCIRVAVDRMALSFWLHSVTVSASRPVASVMRLMRLELRLTARY